MKSCRKYEFIDIFSGAVYLARQLNYLTAMYAFVADVRHLFRRGRSAGPRHHCYTGSSCWLPETDRWALSTSHSGCLCYKLTQPQLWQSCSAFRHTPSPGYLLTCVAVLLHYTVSQKNCTPKAGRHKFIKISSPIMIFHTRHRHSVGDWLSSKSLVWVEYQLQGFHGNQAPWQTTVVM